MGALNAGGCGENIGARKDCERQNGNTLRHLLVVRLQALDDSRNPEVVVALSAVQGPAGTMARV